MKQRFLAFGLLLMTLISSSSAGRSQKAEGKVRVHLGVRAVKIRRINQVAHTLVYEERGKTRSGNFFTAIFLKEGKKAAADQFRPGDSVVVMSTYKKFDLIQIVADQISYAAFCHDVTSAGILKSWGQGQPLCLMKVAGYLWIQDHPKEKDNPDFLQPEPVFYEINSQTQFWLKGVRVIRQQAQRTLTAGTKLFVGWRWKRIPKKIRIGIPAYAVFDEASWRACAQHELKTARDLFQPRSPWYPRIKDSSP